VKPAIIAFALLLAAAAPTFVSNTASAQAYPGRSIRLIVPWPPGGGTDAAGRIMAQALSDGLGGPVVVENRPGASGRIGTEFAAKPVEIGFHFIGGARLCLREDHHLFPGDCLERLFEMRVGPVLIRGIPEIHTVLVRKLKQIGESPDAQPVRLARVAAHAVRARAHGQTRYGNARSSEMYDVSGVFLCDAAGEQGFPRRERQGTGCGCRESDEFPSLHLSSSRCPTCRTGFSLSE